MKLTESELWESDQYNYLILIQGVHTIKDDLGNDVYRVIHQRVGKDTEGNALIEYRNPKKWYLDFRFDADLGMYTHCRIFGIVKWKKLKQEI